MKHIQCIEEQVILFADGDMGEVESRAFETHLAECGDCSAALNGHREALRVVRAGLRDAPAGQEFETDRIRARVSMRRRRMQFATAVTCGCLVMAGLFNVARVPSPEPTVAIESPVEYDPALAALELQIAELRAQVAELRAESQNAIELATLNAESEYSEIAAIAVSAAQHLEDSGLDIEGAHRQYEYIVEFYQDTPAAAVARERLAKSNHAIQSI